MSKAILDAFGREPINIKWNIVRGDTGLLRVEFLQNDEKTHFDISTWEFASSTYDYRGEVVDELEVTKGVGYVDIIASPDITSEWGSGVKSIVAELGFDLEVTIGDFIWTPVIGTIAVTADITGAIL
jgi:hypothetical protein